MRFIEPCPIDASRKGLELDRCCLEHQTQKESLVCRVSVPLQAVKIALEVKKHLVEKDMLDIKQVRPGLSQK